MCRLVEVIDVINMYRLCTNFFYQRYYNRSVLQYASLIKLPMRLIAEMMSQNTCMKLSLGIWTNAFQFDVYIFMPFWG